jgi:hypothetical protein
MNIKSIIWSYKWWLVIGTIFSLLYIGTFIYILTYRIWEHQFASDLRLIIILFIGAIFGEIINKSKNFFYSIIAWISIGIYQGILFYLVYWIIYSFIINQELTKPSSESPLLYPIITTFGLAIVWFIPANIGGGIIVFITKYFIKERKSDTD